MAKKSQSPVPLKRIPVQFAFPDAINALIGGASIKRAEWGDEEEYCLLKDNFLMIHRNGAFHTWIVSEGDLLAKDWLLLK